MDGHIHQWYVRAGKILNWLPKRSWYIEKFESCDFWGLRKEFSLNLIIFIFIQVNKKPVRAIRNKEWKLYWENPRGQRPPDYLDLGPGLVWGYLCPSLISVVPGMSAAVQTWASSLLCPCDGKATHFSPVFKLSSQIELTVSSFRFLILRGGTVVQLR